MTRRKKPRRLRKLSKRKALVMVAEEFRALEPYEPPVVEPLRVSIELLLNTEEK